MCEGSEYVLTPKNVAFFHNNNNNNNNTGISIAPYGRNFRGAGGMSDQCSVKA